MNKYFTTSIEKNGISHIILNRKPVNALSYDFLLELNNTIVNFNKDNKIKIIIISSKLDHFSAGADLKERSIMNSEKSQNALDNFNTCFNTIENSSKITICAINGYCLGGGAELASSCDIRICSKDAMIGFPEVSIGIIPGAGGTQRLPKIIGYANAKYWIYSARKFNADESKEYGFVNFITNTKSELINNAYKIAEEFLKNAPIALSSAKKALQDSYNCNLTEGLQIERKNYNISVKTKDRIEALKAFNLKRKPKWRNK